MVCSSSLRKGMLVVAILGSICSPVFVRAQDATVKLGDEIRQLQQDIETLKGSKESLTGRVDGKLISELAQQIQAKEASLATLKVGMANAAAPQANIDHPTATNVETAPTKNPAQAAAPDKSEQKDTSGKQDSSETSNGDQFSTRVLGLAGIGVASGTAGEPQQQFFAEFHARVPLTRGCKGQNDSLTSKCSGAHWELWGEPKIGSIPTSKTAQLSSLTSISSAASGLGSLTLSDVTQSFEFRGGLEYAFRTAHKAPLFNLVTTRGALVPGFILGGGFISPLSSSTGAQEFNLGTGNGSTGTSVQLGNLAQQFTNSPQLQTEYPQFYNYICPPASGGSSGTRSCMSSESTYQQIAFVLPDRSRFQRNYFAGLRFKVFFFDKFPVKRKNDAGQDVHTCKDANLGRAHDGTEDICPAQIFPAYVDLTFGQDESVTAGKLRGVVMTLGGNFPFPAVPWLRIYGSLHTRLSSSSNFAVLNLPPSATFTALNSSSVFVQPVLPSDQDYFRVGIGVDIDHAIRSLRGAGKGNSQ